MTKTWKAYRQFLAKLYGDLSDCRYGQLGDGGEVGRTDGWTDGEFTLFRNSPTLARVHRDLHLARPTPLFRNKFKLTWPRLADGGYIEVIAPPTAERVLLAHEVEDGRVAEFTGCWPWPVYRHAGRSYSVLFVRYTKRELVHAVLNQYEAAVAAKLGSYRVLGRPTVWTRQDDGRYVLFRRGDGVVLPLHPEAHVYLAGLPEVTADDLMELVQRWRDDAARDGGDVRTVPGKDVRPVSFVIPEGFDDALMPPELRSDADYARYILSTIRLKWAQWEANDDRSVHLHSKVLEQVIPKRSLRAVVAWMINAGIVGRNDSYAVGEYSKSYWVMPEWDARPWRVVPCRLTALSDKLRSWRRLELPVHQHLAGCLGRATFPARALDRVKEMDDAKVKTGERLQYGRNAVIVRLVQDGCWHPNVCAQCRFHSVLTRMDRQLRAMLTLDGQRIVWTDISNSQPLIFGLLLLDYSLNGSLVALASFQRRRQLKGCVREAGGGDRPSPIMFPTREKTREHWAREPVPADVSAYMGRCEAGTLYEHLMEQAGTRLDRDAFKQLVFQEVFYRERSYDSPLFNLFTSIYPTAAKMLDHIRSSAGRSSRGMLSRLMQRCESDLMIRRVAHRIMTERPSVAILTIHDSIGATAEHARYVRAVIREEYGQLGVRPHLKGK